MNEEKSVIYGYCRVSTKRQGADGNSLEAQRELLLSNGVNVIFQETFTGTKLERPELEKLLAVIKPGDSLVVTKLDRMARSISQGISLIDRLINMGVTVNILNLGILDNTPTSKLIRNILLVFADFERTLILERTQQGKEVARQRSDYRDGRPKKFRKSQIDHALGLLNSFSYNQVAEMTGISKSTLIRAKRDAQ